jgi:hypothetical protein
MQPFWFLLQLAVLAFNIWIIYRYKKINERRFNLYQQLTMLGNNRDLIYNTLWQNHLINNHGLHISVYHQRSGGERWHYNLFDLKNGKRVLAGISPDYKSYPEALQAGINKTLELIKLHKII